MPFFVGAWCKNEEGSYMRGDDVKWRRDGGNDGLCTDAFAASEREDW